MTSFEANMLKQPPKNAPQMALRMKYPATSAQIVQKMVSMTVKPMQEQKREYLLMFFLNATKGPEPLTSISSQRQPKINEPTSVPALNTMGILDLQALSPLCVKQVGIQSKNPQRIDFSNPIERRYSLFSVVEKTCLEKSKNSLNLLLVGYYSATLGLVKSYSLTPTQLPSGLPTSFLYFTKMQTMIAITQVMTVAKIIATYHLHCQVSTRRPQTAKPTMLPRSPFADQMPMAVPSFSRLKCSLVNVSRVGQAGNWKNPKTSSPTPGINTCKKKLSLTVDPKIKELIGMQRQPTHAIVKKITSETLRFFFPCSKNLKKKPVPSARYTSASKRPRKRLDYWKAVLNQDLT